MSNFSFQEIILHLQEFWSNYGCSLLQPYDIEVGAGTLHPATALKALGPKPMKIAYVQPSRRPKDSRYGENPNRLSHYYQFQVLLKPAPEDVQDLCIASLKAIGIDHRKHDIRFVEDDWENPTIGAWGLGWEMWVDGMEILQFTYMQQIGEIECELVPAELTYGLERLAMYVQNVDHFTQIKWNNPKNPSDQVYYGELFLRNEQEISAYSLEYADVEILSRSFIDGEKECYQLLQSNLPLAAYHRALNACHYFNLLDARGVLNVTERASYMARVRKLVKECCIKWVESAKCQ
jgi:glycyl-tRNA synthetase alpha chain